MIKFLFWFFTFIFVFDKATRKYLNPYKLIFVFGKKGSGKTTYLTKIAINSKNTNRISKPNRTADQNQKISKKLTNI